MTISGNSNPIRRGEWLAQIHLPEKREERLPVYLLLHGWTGDEMAMWVFANRLPDKYLMIAPRGPHPTPLGGFGWQPRLTQRWPDYSALLPTCRDLLGLIDDLASEDEYSAADFSGLNLMGFSQGAAVAYTFALAYPQRVRSLVGLAGFMPDAVSALLDDQPLAGLPAFVAHGSQDDTVPVARARQSVELLERAGAQVTYCEDDVGHKLSSNCFRAMRAFVDTL